jgi:copper chaperone
MEKTTLSIPKISCGHCVNTIKNELLEVKGVASVDGSAEAKQVMVEFESPATMEKIRQVLQEIGYPAE